MSETPKCELCGEPMPPGEEMFKFHGYSGSCPKPPLPTTQTQPGEAKKQSMLYEACPRCDGMGQLLSPIPGGKSKNCFGCKCLYVVETGATAGQLNYLVNLDTLRQEAGITAAMLRDGRARKAIQITQDMHASAPAGYKCSDCTIDGEPCPACYTAAWKKRHPNTEHLLH